MSNQAIIDFIKQQQGTDIPSLQQKFGLTYKQARDIIRKLVSERCLAFTNGVRYVCVGKFVEKPAPLRVEPTTSSSSPPENRDEAMSQFLHTLEARRTERIRREQQRKVEEGAENFRRKQQRAATDDSAEECALIWLRDKLSENAELSLFDAKFMSGQEYVLARRESDKDTIDAKEIVFNYFKECSDFSFTLLKMRAIGGF